MSRKSDLKLLDHTGAIQPVKSTRPDAVAERKRQALEQFARGLSTSDVARVIGIGRWTLHDWYRKDENFRAAKDAILANRDMDAAEDFEELAHKIARGGEGVTKDGLPNYTAVRDILKVTNRNRWGDKKEVTHGGTVIHTLIPSAKRLDELVSADVIDVTDVPALDAGEDEE